jgi:hypothetical protein
VTDPVAFPSYPPAPGLSAPVPGDDSSGGNDLSFVQRWAPRADLRAGLIVVLALAVLGAALGIVWQWWSPPSGLGFMVGPNEIQPDQTEAFVAADGRFAVIVGAVGLVAGVLAWRRTSTRGPVVAAALALGGFVGSLLTAAVGHLVAGGSNNGKPGDILHKLPLSLHMHGLLLLEAVVAVMVYSICVSFATRDDLGRPDVPGDENQSGVGQPQFG